MKEYNYTIKYLYLYIQMRGMIEMDKINSALEQIREINQNYNISLTEIDKLQDDIRNAKVCIPVIGKFSSGKSALVNTILGYSKDILKTDITPETAIPAEIVYDGLEEKVTIVKNDGSEVSMDVDEYKNYEADANTAKSACIQLNNSFLKEIPDVMLVDMPGFDSGFEIHNKAIDNYLPASMAYIIAVPADDMIIRTSVGNILKELCINDMPICIVITKFDKKTDTFEETFEKMKESLKKFIGSKEVKYCITSSFTGDAEELEEFLREVQENSQKLFEEKYKKLLIPVVENTENYLKTTLNSSRLSESELEEKEENLQNQMNSLNSKLSKEQEDFTREAEECVDEIKADLQRAVEAEESTLVTMLLNGQDIKESLNTTTRNAVTSSIKKRFTPKVEKYIKRVSKVIDSEAIGDVNISYTVDTKNLDKNMTGNIVAVAATALLGIPLLGIIAVVTMNKIKDKKREEAKQKIQVKLRKEVFPQVVNEVGHKIKVTITEQIKLVNSSIEKELVNQRQTLEKAMSDLKQQINDEQTEKESLLKNIQSDLEKTEVIRNEL